MLPSAAQGRHTRQRQRLLRPDVLIAALVVLLVFAICYRTVHLKGKLQAVVTAPSPSLEQSRSRILQEIESWNAKATSEGLATSEQIMLADAVSTVPNPAVVAKLSTSDGPLAASSCDCEKHSPDPRWQMQPASVVAEQNPALAEALKQHAVNNEIMLALANGIMICKNATICWWNGGNILESFLEIIDHNKITNHLIGVMDDETEAYLKGRPYNYFRVNIAIPESQKNSHPANKVSTIKYTLLKQIIQMGYDALITDMDLVYLKNPFDHLHRDADIEIQTDGFDDVSYGVIDSVHDPSMGWGGGGLFMRLFTTNVGCVWVKSNARTFALMSQVSEHLQTKAGWDQQVFNEYLLMPSHGDFKNAGCSLRVMDYMKFVNSKIFFKSRREMFIPGASATAEAPLMVHFNYHPDKHVRMLCIMDRYFKGNVSACDHFPAGSEPK